jgi:hypothetical protein
MGLLKGAIKAGIAMKVLEIIQREARKPENQRKAKELFAKLSERGANRRYRH